MFLVVMNFVDENKLKKKHDDNEENSHFIAALDLIHCTCMTTNEKKS